MTPRERVAAALAGGEVDRVPLALWRHFYAEEREARTLADVTVAFTKRHDMDLVKLNSRADYQAEPWGTSYTSVEPKVYGYAVKGPDDWARITPRGLGEASFQDLLEGLRLVRAALPDRPLLATIFTPLGVLGRLAPAVQVLEDIRLRPGAVLGALDAVAETMRALAAAACEIADGIFLATTAVPWWPDGWGGPPTAVPHLSAAEYARFGTPFDLRVLDGAKGARVTMMHVCGDQAPVLALGAAYPVSAVSWNVDGRGHPALDEARRAFGGKAVVGGLSNPAMHYAERARRDARDGVARTGGRGWIASGACTIPVTSSGEAIDAARDVLRSPAVAAR